MNEKTNEEELEKNFNDKGMHLIKETSSKKKMYIDNGRQNEIYEENSDFKKRSKELYDLITQKINCDSDYIKLWRRIWSFLILGIIILCNIGIASIIVYKIVKDKSFDTTLTVSTITALIVQIVGLITIVFKFLFNNTDNKNADVYLKILELTELYEEKFPQNAKNNNTKNEFEQLLNAGFESVQLCKKKENKKNKSKIK